jgi:type IV pilus assembly protein PilN
MIKINLLPVKEAKKRTTIQNQLVLAVVVLLVVIAGVIYMGYIRKKEISHLNNTVAQKQQRLRDLQEVQKKVEQFKKDNENLSQKISVIAGLENGRDWYLQVLDQISEAIPKEVWIDELKTPVAKDMSKGFWEIKGGALEKDQISNFMSNMEKKNKYFSVVSLKRVERQKATTEINVPYYRYEMSIQIKGAPQVQPGAG